MRRRVDAVCHAHHDDAHAVLLAPRHPLLLRLEEAALQRAQRALGLALVAAVAPPLVRVRLGLGLGLGLGLANPNPTPDLRHLLREEGDGGHAPLALGLGRHAAEHVAVHAKQPPLESARARGRQVDDQVQVVRAVAQDVRHALAVVEVHRLRG